MSSFFDDLEAQLAGAARAQTAVQDTARRGGGRDRGRRARGRTWGATAAQAVPVGLTVLATLAIAVLAVTLLHHVRAGNASHRPASPPPSSNGPIQLLPTNPNRTQRQEITYLYDAQANAARQDQVCNSDRSQAGFGNPALRPSLSQAAPSAATLAILGVLRRPAVPSDKLPPRLIGAPPHQHVYPDGTIPPVKDVYIRYVRKARHRFGANYYVIPAGDVNSLVPVPARCWAEQRVALQRELPTIPARLRAGVLALEPLFVAQQRHNDLPYPGVCLIGINDTGNGGGGCDAGGSLSQIQDGTGAMPSDAPTGVGVVDGLVPDGVRTVTFEYQRHRSVTVLAINNVFIVRRQGLPNYGFPNTILWRAADGRIIKVIHRP
jgi:hypothetical protein